MKPGSIYAAFSSKENLYLLALERYFARSRAGFRDQVARAALPLNALADPQPPGLPFPGQCHRIAAGLASSYGA